MKWVAIEGNCETNQCVVGQIELAMMNACGNCHPYFYDITTNYYRSNLQFKIGSISTQCVTMDYYCCACFTDILWIDSAKNGKYITINMATERGACNGVCEGYAGSFGICNGGTLVFFNK